MFSKIPVLRFLWGLENGAWHLVSIQGKKTKQKNSLLDNVGGFLRNVQGNCAVVPYSGFGETPRFELYIFFVMVGKLLNLLEPP